MSTRRTRPRRLFSGITGWYRILLTTTASSSFALMIAVTIAAFVAGGAAAGSAALGGGAVVVFSFFSLAVIVWAERYAPRYTIPLVVGGFSVKLGCVGILLAVVGTQDWIDARWAVLTAVFIMVVSQIIEVSGFMNLRLPVNSDIPSS